MVNVELYVPGDSAVLRKISEAVIRKVRSHRFEETDAGTYHVLTFPRLPQSIDAVLLVIGALARIPRAWATVGGQRMSSLVALCNRLDCYRQSLSHLDRIAYCRGKAARLQALLGCTVPSCASPCQFVHPQCKAKENPSTASLVHSETQMLLVFGEVDWCPNLVRLAESKRSHCLRLPRVSVMVTGCI